MENTHPSEKGLSVSTPPTIMMDPEVGQGGMVDCTEAEDTAVNQIVEAGQSYLEDDERSRTVRRANRLRSLRIEEETPDLEEGVDLHIYYPPTNNYRERALSNLEDASELSSFNNSRYGSTLHSSEFRSLDLDDLVRDEGSSLGCDGETEIAYLNDQKTGQQVRAISRKTPERNSSFMSNNSFGSSWDSRAIRKANFDKGEKATPRLISVSGASSLKNHGESMSTFRSMNLSKQLSFSSRPRDIEVRCGDSCRSDDISTKYSGYVQAGDGSHIVERDDADTQSQAVSQNTEPPTNGQRYYAFLAATNDWMRRKLQWIYLVVMMYAAPVCIALWAPTRAVSALYYTSIAAIIFINAWMICEVVMSFKYTARVRALHSSQPEIIGERRLGSIVAAYLPNELTVLVDSIKAISETIHELPDGTTLDIVLAHNGGKAQQRVQLLDSLRRIEVKLPANVMVHELNVLSSTSKAENVNAALGFFEELGNIRGEEFTQLSMYDADHQPIPQAWRYALETMQDQKADMVMGRCCVHDGLKYIAIEFDILYGVAHAGGRCVRGFGFFGGSNGYWDYQTLQETGMDEGMLTEDVDSSFRAQAAGHYMTYDPTIVSFEESPPDFSSLFKQRLRWAQGWYEVTLRQITLPFRKAPGLTLWSRFCIFLVLPFREVYVYLSSFTVPIAVVYLVSSGCGWACIDYYLLGMMCVCLSVPILNTIAAWYLTYDRDRNVHYRNPTLTAGDYVRYIFISYPYELFKIHVTVLGHARQLIGLNKWVVTRRKTNGVKEFTSTVLDTHDPESLMQHSPFAPPVRRMFSGTYDEKRADAIKHCSTAAKPIVSNVGAFSEDDCSSTSSRESSSSSPDLHFQRNPNLDSTSKASSPEGMGKFPSTSTTSCEYSIDDDYSTSIVYVIEEEGTVVTASSNASPGGEVHHERGYDSSDESSIYTDSWKKDCPVQQATDYDSSSSERQGLGDFSTQLQRYYSLIDQMKERRMVRRMDIAGGVNAGLPKDALQSIEHAPPFVP